MWKLSEIIDKENDDYYHWTMKEILNHLRGLKSIKDIKDYLESNTGSVFNNIYDVESRLLHRSEDLFKEYLQKERISKIDGII